MLNTIEVALLLSQKKNVNLLWVHMVKVREKDSLGNIFPSPNATDLVTCTFF